MEKEKAIKTLVILIPSCVSVAITIFLFEGVIVYRYILDNRNVEVSINDARKLYIYLFMAASCFMLFSTFLAIQAYWKLKYYKEDNDSY